MTINTTHPLNKYIQIKPYYIDTLIEKNADNLTHKNISHGKLKTALYSNQLYPYVHNMISDKVVEFYIAGALCKLDIKGIYKESPVDFSDSYINKVIKEGPSEEPGYYKVVGQYLGRISDNVLRVHYVCKDIDVPFGGKDIFIDRHTNIKFVEDDEQLLKLVKRAEMAWKL